MAAAVAGTGITRAVPRAVPDDDASLATVDLTSIFTVAVGSGPAIAFASAATILSPFTVAAAVVFASSASPVTFTAAAAAVAFVSSCAVTLVTFEAVAALASAATAARTAAGGLGRGAAGGSSASRARSDTWGRLWRRLRRPRAAAPARPSELGDESDLPGLLESVEPACVAVASSEAADVAAAAAGRVATRWPSRPPPRGYTLPLVTSCMAAGEPAPTKDLRRAMTHLAADMTKVG